MPGFIVPKQNLINKLAESGRAIIRLSQSAAQTPPGAEWVAFEADPKAWLYANGYHYIATDGAPGTPIPANIDIVPVRDTATKMHVRIPYAPDLASPPVPPATESYGMNEDSRFPVLLARYFVRKCR
jgi:hypothetical protein